MKAVSSVQSFIGFSVQGKYINSELGFPTEAARITARVCPICGGSELDPDAAQSVTSCSITRLRLSWK